MDTINIRSISHTIATAVLIASTCLTSIVQARDAIRQPIHPARTALPTINPALKQPMPSKPSKKPYRPTTGRLHGFNAPVELDEDIPFSDSISFTPSAVALLCPGDTVSISAAIHRSQTWLAGGQPKNLFLSIHSVPQGLKFDLSASLISSAVEMIDIDITASSYAVNGHYTPSLMALFLETDGQQAFSYGSPLDVYVNADAEECINSPPQTDPPQNIAELTFSAPLDNTIEALYSNGEAPVYDVFAIYDTNQNGFIDFEVGNNNVPFPGFLASVNQVVSGRGYANPYGSQANIIVAVRYNSSGYEWLALHLRVSPNGQVVPIQALVGNFANGAILIQDLGGWSYAFDGELPDNAQNGFIEGSIAFDPFLYDGLDNTIYGNHIELYFDVALEPDA